MKPPTLPVKRRPVPKGMLHRLSAVTRNRKQRVAAAAAAPATDMDAEDGGSKISRALTIIFLIHIVAIGLIFVHQRFLDGRPEETKTAANTAVSEGFTSSPTTPADGADLPRLSTGDRPYVVQPGDNYARIAVAQGVNEQDLRILNKHADIRPSLILKIPPQRIVAEDPPEVAAIREQTPSDRDRGLVEAVDVTDAPKAQMIRTVNHGTQPPATTAGSTPAVAGSGKTYVVQSGDSVWRIANRFKINQDSLMRANGISDARKMKIGMKLVIPQG